MLLCPLLLAAMLDLAAAEPYPRMFDVGGGRTRTEVLAKGWSDLDYRVPREMVREPDGDARRRFGSPTTPWVIRTLAAGERPLPGHVIEQRTVQTFVVPATTNRFGNRLTFTVDTFAGTMILKFDGHNAPPTQVVKRNGFGFVPFDFGGSHYEFYAGGELRVVKGRATSLIPGALTDTKIEAVQVPKGIASVRTAIATLDDAPEVHARHERQTRPPLTRAQRDAIRATEELKAIRKGLQGALRSSNPKDRLSEWRAIWSERRVPAATLDRQYRELTAPVYATGPSGAAQNLMHIVEKGGAGRGLTGRARDVAIWQAAADYARQHPTWGGAIEALNRYDFAPRPAQARRRR